MTRLEILKRQTELAEEMRGLVDKAKAEKRGLSQEEQSRFEALELEQRALQIDAMSAMFLGAQGQEAGSVQKRFLEFACDAMSGNSGRQMTYDVRSVVNFDAVKDTSVPILFQDLADPLEKGLVVSKLGCKVLYGVAGLPLFPEVDAPEASVLGEDEEVKESTLNFKKVTPSPKRISMSIPVSRTALNMSNYGLYGVVMSALGLGIARKLNSIMFSLSKTGDYSGPFVDLSEDQQVKGTLQAGWNHSLIVDTEHAVLDQMVEALGGQSAYIMNTKTAAALKKTQLSEADKEMLLKMHIDPATDYRYGFLNSYRSEFSNYVPENTLLFGDFRYCGISQFGPISFIVDPYSKSRENKVVFTVNTDMDITALRKQAFSMAVLE